MEKGKYVFSPGTETEDKDYDRAAEEIRQAFFQAQEENAFDHGDSTSIRNREQEFLSLIGSGNPQLLESYLRQDFPAGRPVTIGILSEDPLQQAKYIFVSGVTLATRSAMDSGLPETTARAISDAYIRYVDQITDPERIGGMFLHACKTFCSFVGAFRLSGMQPELRRCCEYMSTHLHASVTMEDLCRATGLSAYRINTLFRRELAASPIQYFLAQKVVYGKRLLESTDMPVSQIAELLAFPSHSSFTQRFRKTYGLTPQEYRAQQKARA